MISPYSFVIDYETTGFDAIRNDGITLGVDVLNHNLESIDQAYFKFKPDLYRWMNEDNVAAHIHKFSLKEMLFFPERRDGLIGLMKFLLPYKCPKNLPRPLFYHSDNKHFDYRFLEWAFRKENLEYSLWKIFQLQNSHPIITLGRSLGYEKNSLEVWGERLGETFNHHNALSDAKMSSKVIRYILNNNFQGNVESFFEHLSKGKNQDDKTKSEKENEVQEMPEEKREWSFFDI